MKTHDCVVESSNEDGLARAIGSELSQQEKEPPCSSTVDCHKTVNDETQVNIFYMLLGLSISELLIIVYAFLVLNRPPLRQVI